MSGFLIVLGMGAAAWWAWPAAATFATKVWTVVFAVFLAPFSWPWLAARGYRARRAARTEQQRRELTAVEQQRRENIAWWRNEWHTAGRDGDTERQNLAGDVLASMGVNRSSW